MPQTSERYKKFLSTYDFYSNSISFRVHSSKALEKWKNVQAFQLNQLIYGKFFFPQDRREIVLLKYDLWSRWLYEIENLMIELSGEHSSNNITNDDIGLIISLAEKTAIKYNDVVSEEHKERFNQEFTNIWLESHSIVSNYMLEKFKTFVGQTYDEAYRNIVDTLVDVMQYTLTEIHELDVIFCDIDGSCDNCSNVDTCGTMKLQILKDHIPFVAITPLSEKLWNSSKICLICEKLKVFKKYFKITEIYLKNYTDNRISEELIKNIENLGISINFRKSI